MQNRSINTSFNFTISLFISFFFMSVSTPNLFLNFGLEKIVGIQTLSDLSNDSNHSDFAKIFIVVNDGPPDSTLNKSDEKDKSDLFYYILGIFILIASGFILKQRYEQYLKQRDGL
jgi:hypothetical protein